MIQERTKEIDLRLKRIFKSRLGIDFDKAEKENPSLLVENLLGDKFGLKARHLLYLFFDIEKEFGITIPETRIASGQFNTYNNMLDIICDQLN